MSLVSDVLYMPKIEAENVEISLRPVDLDRCLDEVTSTCRNLVSQNGNEFVLEKAGTLGIIETDETRLRQILINLLGNAGKFTKDGKVLLRARRETASKSAADHHLGRRRWHRHSAGSDRRIVHEFQSSQCRDYKIVRRIRARPGRKP